MGKKKVNYSKRKIIAIIGIVATAAAVFGGLANIYHWWEIDWNAISYHPITPFLGLASWIGIVTIYKIKNIKNIALWTIASFWLIYNFILMLMIYGGIK